MDKRKRITIIIGLTFLVFTMIAYVLSSSPSNNQQHIDNAHQEQTQIWTCSMHPQIREDKPGKCPICGMDLIPLTIDSSSGNEQGTVELSQRAIKLAEVETTAARREILSANINMVGKIDFDETREVNISAWFPGRIERLFIDYTGVKVNKGDHMVEIYGPEVVAAQQELIQSIKTAKQISKSKYSDIKEMTTETIEDVRNKLRLWGFNEIQIKDIENKKKASEKMTIYAPVGGVVIKKYVQEGEYVQTGSKIYSIADLSHLWVKLDAYESDIDLIRYGQEVEFNAEGLPGTTFKGRISFISPVVDQQTRTIKIRVNIENPEGKLRPGMFVNAKVYARISEQGVVMDSYLDNKMVCPMHPEIIQEKEGNCPICGMNLVPTSQLGYKEKSNATTAPIVIPASAPLITGERAIVYISIGSGKYQGREVVLGSKVGDHYIVYKGIQDGEKVVVNGNFKIDSAAQLQASPSMMNPTGKQSPVTYHHAHAGAQTKITISQTDQIAPSFKEKLDPIFRNYFELHKEFYQDRFDNLKTAGKELLKSVEGIDTKELESTSKTKWTKMEMELRGITEEVITSKNLEEAREKFRLLSDLLISIIKNFGTSKNITAKTFFCPMAFGGGAFWLQESENTLNPYYGQEMLTCGEIKEQE